jgi:hypothetical protein
METVWRFTASRRSINLFPLGPPLGRVAAVRVTEQEAHPGVARSARGAQHRHQRDGHAPAASGSRTELDICVRDLLCGTLTLVAHSRQELDDPMLTCTLCDRSPPLTGRTMSALVANALTT